MARPPTRPHLCLLCRDLLVRVAELQLHHLVDHVHHQQRGVAAGGVLAEGNLHLRGGTAVAVRKEAVREDFVGSEDG